MHRSIARGTRLGPLVPAARVAAAWALPLVIGLVALGLRLHGLGDKPLWLDEVTTLHRVTLRLPDLIADALRNKHYPAYFLLLWPVAKLGTSAWLLRLPSAVFGAVDAVLVYAIGREVAGRRAGVMAGLLLAFSPFDVQYGQEARSYTLAACLILVTLWGLLRLAREPAIAARPLRWNRLPPLPWLAYCGGMVGALNVLNVAIPWLLAANLAAVAIGLRAGQSRPAFMRNWARAQAIVVALWLPSLAAVFFASSGEVLRGPGWAPPPTLATLWSIVSTVYLDRIGAFITFEVLPTKVPGLSIALAAAAAWGAWRLRRTPTSLAIIASAAFGLPLLLLLVSFATPVLVPRYFAWSAAPFFVLAGTGIAQLTRWRYATGAAALAVACLLNVLPDYRQETKPRWDLAAARLAADAEPGDVVLLNNRDSYLVLRAHAARDHLDERGLFLTWRPAEAARCATGHRLWVLYGRAGQEALPAPVEYAASLAALGEPVDDEAIGRYVILWRFRQPNTLAAAFTTQSDCLTGDPPEARQ